MPKRVHKEKSDFALEKSGRGLFTRHGKGEVVAFCRFACLCNFLRAFCKRYARYACGRTVGVYSCRILVITFADVPATPVASSIFKGTG